MSVNRSDKYTILNKKIQQYSDFTTSFAKNPLSGFLARMTNEEAIKQSIRNLVFTERTERFYRPDIGSKIWSLLFEPVDAHTEDLLKKTIDETIRNNEPRVDLMNVVVRGDPDTNTYMISIQFSIKTIPNSNESMVLLLRRVR